MSEIGHRPWGKYEVLLDAWNVKELKAQQLKIDAKSIVNYIKGQ